MLSSLGSEFSHYLDGIWSMWVGMANGVPYWDPYGAMSAVILGLALIGLGVKKVMDGGA